MSGEPGTRFNLSLITRHSSLLSKCCSCRLVRQVGARLYDVAHLAYDEFQLFFFGVEVWRDAHTRAGTIIDDELAADQLTGDGCRVIQGHCDRAAALRRVVRARHAKPC